MQTVSRAFLAARMHARERDIEFKFSKKQWIAWWECHLGPDWFSRRGCKKHQYVMARKEDRGCYEVGNVRCVLSIDNHAEKKLLGNHPHGEKHPHARLTGEDIKAIRAAKVKLMGRYSGEIKALAEKYHVSRRTIADIRAKRRWKHV
jgi:hypothetical protein